MRGWLARGLVVGLAGTASLSLFEACECVLLGRDPIYAACRIVKRLSARYGWSREPRRIRRRALLIRLSYGALLGIGSILITPCARAQVDRAIRVLGIAASICAFELAVLPLAGATPPLRSWRPLELALLPVHTATYAAGAELGRAGLDAVRQDVTAAAHRAASASNSFQR